MRITKKQIIDDQNPRLREKSEDVILPLKKEDKQTLEDLLLYVRNSTDEELAKQYDLRPAVGIAAPQVGILKKMLAISFVDDKDKGVEYALVNPKIISHAQQKTYLKSGEGCLSVQDEHKGYVIRNARITVEAYDLLQDKNIRIRAKGYEAIVLQHEIDHLHGVLFYDHINKENPFLEVQDAIVIE